MTNSTRRLCARDAAPRPRRLFRAADQRVNLNALSTLNLRPLSDHPKLRIARAVGDSAARHVTRCPLAATSGARTSSSAPGWATHRPISPHRPRPPSPSGCRRFPASRRTHHSRSPWCCRTGSTRIPGRHGELHRLHAPYLSLADSPHRYKKGFLEVWKWLATTRFPAVPPKETLDAMYPGTLLARTASPLRAFALCLLVVADSFSAPLFPSDLSASSLTAHRQPRCH